MFGFDLFKNRVSFGSAAALCFVVGTCVTTISNTPAVAASAAPVPSSSSLGISVDAKGWIRYNTGLVGASGLSNALTTTVKGAPGVGGACVFSSPISSTPATAGYSEETAFNPKTCQETVESGTLNAVGRVKLAAAAQSS